ncbi:unnamed protein product [Absidia cylindrospora]
MSSSTPVSSEWSLFLLAPLSITMPARIQEVDNPASTNLVPTNSDTLTYFILFFSSKNNHHSCPDDPIIIHLYDLEFSLLPYDHSLEASITSTLETICGTNEQLFKRVLEKINRLDKDKIRRICERGLEYNRKVKHRYLDESNTSGYLAYSRKVTIVAKNNEDYEAYHVGRRYQICNPIQVHLQGTGELCRISGSSQSNYLSETVYTSIIGASYSRYDPDYIVDTPTSHPIKILYTDTTH